MFGQLRSEVEGLIDDVIQLTYYMRGALSYDEAMMRTPGERERIGNFIEKRLESQAKSMHPVY